MRVGVSAALGGGQTRIREAVVVQAYAGGTPANCWRMLKTGQRPLLDAYVLHWHQLLKFDGSRLAQLMGFKAVEPDEARYAASRHKEADISSINDAVRRLQITYDNDGE